VSDVELHVQCQIEPSRLGLARVGDDVAVGERERTGSTTFLPVLSRLSFVDWVTGGERQRGGEINRGFLVASKAQAVTLRLVYVGFGMREIWVQSARPV
jgi:hypothetical protein